MFSKKKTEEVQDTVRRVTLDEVVAGLTLDEKISLVSGKDFWHTVEVKDSPVKLHKSRPTAKKGHTVPHTVASWSYAPALARQSTP